MEAAQVEKMIARVPDEKLEHAMTPSYIRNRSKQVQDPVIAAQAQRLAQIRQDDRPLVLNELEAARNRAVREMIRRMNEMKPGEIIDAVELLDGEIASRKVTKGEDKVDIKATREEMIKKLMGDNQPEVQG